MSKKNIPVIILTLVFILSSISLFAKDKKDSNLFKLENKKDKTGLIFNTNDLLLDIESYQGGLGIKRYLKEDTAIRGLLDFNYSKANNSFLINVGASLEHHLSSGRITPYIGGFLNLEFIYYKDEIDADNWTKVSSFPISIGPMFGAELFIFDFLSVFAEYNLAISYTITTTKTSVAGNTSKSSDSSFGVDLSIGNDSKLGIVLYFGDIKLKNELKKIKKKKK